jgi:hypothetical protein
LAAGQKSLKTGVGIAGLWERQGMKKSTSKDKPAAPGKQGASKPAGSEEAGSADRQPVERGRTVHNGSAGAFDATEDMQEDDDDDYQDNDDFAMDR